MTTDNTGTRTAELWRRIAAILYDSIVVIAIWVVVGFLVLSAFGIDRVQTPEGGGVALDPLYRLTLFSAMLLSAYLFFAWFWTHSGQTIGMQAWKIRVQNHDGTPIGYRQSLIRCLVAPPSLLCLGIGYLMMLFTPERETLPDKLSTSQVVRVPFQLGSPPE